MSQELTTIKPATFEAIKERFVQLVDPDTFAKEVSFACQILAKNDYLAKSAQHTIQAAVLNVAQLGLSLNPVLKLAYLVPRYNRASRSTECCLEPSYQGLSKLWVDSGSGKNIAAQLVWEGDEIEVDLASQDKVKKHTPYMLRGKEPGKIVAVYSIATLADGTREIEIMSAQQVYDVRERSESWKKAKDTPGMQTIWTTDEGEMFRKTVIRRHFKYLPKSDRFEKVAEAVKLDEQDYGISDAQWNLLERLLHTAQIPQDRRDEIERGMNNYSSIDATLCIEYLKMNQPVDFVKELGREARKISAPASNELKG